MDRLVRTGLFAVEKCGRDHILFREKFGVFA